MKYAPIAIFAYNRLNEIKLVIESLKKNKFIDKSKIYVFLDGPKNDYDRKKNEQIKFFLNYKSNLKNAKILQNKKNLGLKKNINKGLNYIFKKYEKSIIIEDDILVSPNFLEVMNFYLTYYSNNSRVCSIEGYMYPIEFKDEINEVFLLKGTGGWGWGTWRRAWKNYSNKRNKLISKLENMGSNAINDFNYKNSYNYFKILKENKNSWAINWYASNFIKKKYTVFFKNSLVKNIGFGNSATHTIIDYKLNVKKFKKKHKIFVPKNMEENNNAKKQISLFLKKKFNSFNKLKLKLKYLLNVK